MPSAPFSVASAPPRAAPIKGRITFTGKEPGNRVIRMGMDPMCAAANARQAAVNEIYLVGDNNTLGNVFVKLEGSFPATPVPSQPVEIDQVACVYKPRVVGARVGQTLRVKNSDNLAAQRAQRLRQGQWVQFRGARQRHAARHHG